MLNDEYEPASDYEEQILDVLREEGRMRPKHISDELDVHRGAIGHYLKRLLAAGWIGQPHDGLYEYQHDPREMDTDQITQLHREHATRLEEGLTEANDVDLSADEA